MDISFKPRFLKHIVLNRLPLDVLLQKWVKKSRRRDVPQYIIDESISGRMRELEKSMKYIFSDIVFSVFVHGKTILAIQIMPRD